MRHETLKSPRVFLIASLLALAALSTYGAIANHPLLWLITLTLLFGLLFIRFKKIELRSNKILYRDKSILPFLNEFKVIYLDSISSIETYPGYFDKTFFIIDMLFPTSWRGNKKPARITFTFNTGESYSIVKFGTKRGFDLMITEIKARVPLIKHMQD